MQAVQSTGTHQQMTSVRYLETQQGAMRQFDNNSKQQQQDLMLQWLCIRFSTCACTPSVKCACTPVSR